MDIWNGRRHPFLAVFVLLAFFLQSLATQTHIHPQSGISTIAKTSPMPQALGQSKKGHTPVQDNPDNCPLCQMFYGGQYVAPNALVFLLPMAAAFTAQIASGVTPHYDAVSHSWLGRAPPRQ